MRDKDNVLLENAYSNIYSKTKKEMEDDRGLIPDSEEGDILSSLNRKLKKIEEREIPVYIKPSKSAYMNEFGSLRHLQPVGPYKLSINKENQRNYGLYFFDLDYIGDQESPKGLLNPDKSLEFNPSKTFKNLNAKNISSIFKENGVWVLRPNDEFSEFMIMDHNRI